MRMAFGLCRVQSGQCTWKAQLNCLCSICKIAVSFSLDLNVGEYTYL